jgi:ABC-type phosphate transport system ATPase subunit
MDFPTGLITSLIRPSGCGKTTLLRSLNRLHDKTPGAEVMGSVRLGDLDIYAPDVNPTEIRARIGMVFQRANPFPTLSIYDNVVSGLRLNGIRKKSIHNDAAESSLRAAGLWESVSHKLKTSAMRLSGGEKHYGSTRAVDCLTFDVVCGEVSGLLGPNGAGTTTTVEILEGYRQVDSGTIRVLGLDPWPDAPDCGPASASCSKRVGFTPASDRWSCSGSSLPTTTTPRIQRSCSTPSG